jgi:hypothetical protein
MSSKEKEWYMKEERLEILNMLKEGKLTVDEAERLLKALDQAGDRPGEGHGDRDSRRGHRPHTHEQFVDFAPFKDFGKMFRGFGKAVGGTMRSAFSEGGMMRRFDEAEGYEELECGTAGIVLEPGTSLLIRQPKHMPNVGGDVVVLASNEERLVVEGEDYVLRRKDSEYVLVVADDCRISVPATVTSLSVALFSGDVSVQRVPASVTVNTMNGDIRLDEVVLANSCTTMSGDISVRLTGIDASNAELTTMSGDIEAAVPTDWRGVIAAETMSGDIDLDFPGVEVRRDPGPAGMRVRASIGDDPHLKQLRCTTMSGDIHATPISVGSHADSE